MWCENLKMTDMESGRSEERETVVNNIAGVAIKGN
jgi:hypothetical protein